MIERETAIFRWVDREGLLLKHKDLRATEILERYHKACVPSEDGKGWNIIDKSAESDQSFLPPLFSKLVVDERIRLL